MIRWLVVGAGSAGCVVAARLAEHTDHEVTLVEAGNDHGPTTAPHRGPVLDVPELLAADWLVTRRPGSPPEPYLQGRGLGGSSLVNGGIVVGDPDEARRGHALPIEPIEPNATIGPVGRAVLDADSDAAPVSIVAERGRRRTVADIVLRAVTQADAVRVLTDVTVAQIVVDGRRAVGVVTVDGDHLDADRVVVSAGALGSPTLLLRSGIEVVGLGEGLQDHAGVTLAFDLVESPGSDVAGSDVAGSDVAAIGVTVERPGRQIVVIDRLHGAPGMGALLAGHLDVTSVGRVSLPDPAGPPLVELRQLTTDHDLRGLGKVTREALDLLDDAHLRSVVGAVYADAFGTPASTLAGDGELRDWLTDHLGGYHHAMGTCRPGTVTDDGGAVVGYHGLYVCDASALGVLPTANPHLAVVRLAERQAARWCAG